MEMPTRSVPRHVNAAESRLTRERQMFQTNEPKNAVQVLSVKEAAAYLCVGRNTIYNLLNKGRLTKLETGFRRRLIKRAELDEIIAGNR